MSLRPKTLDFDKVFGSLQTAFLKLFERDNNTPVTGLDLYQTVYDLCTCRAPSNRYGYTFETYTGLENFLKERARQSLMDILSKPKSLTQSYLSQWLRFSTAAFYMDQVCEFLNRMLLKYRKNKIQDDPEDIKGEFQTIEALAYSIWKKDVIMIMKTTHDDILMTEIIELAQKARDGHLVPFEVIHGTVRSLTQVNKFTDSDRELYTSYFEEPFISATAQYYGQESTAKINELSTSEFMILASKRLDDEKKLLSKICDESSLKKILSESETQYIGQHQFKLQSEFETMIVSGQHEDCTRMHRLLSRIPQGIEPLLSSFETHVAETCKSAVSSFILSSTKDPKDFVENFHKLHTDFSLLKVKVFDDDPLYMACIDRAFSTVINEACNDLPIKTPELLARYCDSLLKKSPKSTLSESEIDTKLAGAAILFKYVDDKDVFQKFYTRFLARRLVNFATASEECESSMITKLKGTCGAEYTNKLQRMLTDIRLSDEMNVKYKKSRDIKGPSEFHVLVLTSGSWPFSSNNSMQVVPPELEPSIESFTKFYSSQHTGRKLTWLHHLSRMDVRTSGYGKTYELNTSVPQFLLLRQYNNQSSLTVKRLVEESLMPLADARKNLKILIESELLKAQDSSLSENSVVEWNPSFVSKKIKIKLPSGVANESQQEADAMKASINEDRKLFLQATAVRIMKSRKELEHSQLVAEIIQQSKSRFSPSVPMIKKCIEQLIDKQYLERSTENRDIYLYIN